MFSAASTPRIVGRYALFGEIAAGGMASVHLGRLLGPVGFARTVAIKCLHAHFAKDPEFVAMFLDEARLAARIRHPNVVPTLDVVALDGEVFLVMEYVHGEALSRLCRGVRASGQRIPPKITAAVVSGVLHGLHAAHGATSELGQPLGIAHRDVSPQNVLVGADGVARVLDFGIAKASGRVQITRDGRVKGKTGYMSPEQLTGNSLDLRTDVYSSSVVLWEALTGERLFDADNEHAAADKVKNGRVRRPSEVAPELAPFDAVTLRGLERNPGARFESAREMAIALERCQGIATPSEVADWVERVAGVELRRRGHAVAEIEGASSHPSEVRRFFDAPPAGRTSSEDPEEPPTRQASQEPTRIDEDAPTIARVEVPTGVSMARPGAVDMARRPSLRAIAAGVAVLLVTLLLTLALRRGSTPAPATPSVAAATASPASPDAPSPVSSVSPGDAAPVTMDPAPQAARLPAPPLPLRAGPRTARPRPACNPPYDVDGQGIRHIRRECL